MTTTLTPPPLPPQAPGPVSPRPNRTAALVVTILTAALGIAIIVAAVWGGLRTSLRSAMAIDETQSVVVDGGVRELSVDVAAGGLTIRFDDVEEASLEVRGTSRPWLLERDGDELVVRTPEGAFSSWFGGGHGRGILTLPQNMAGADADLALGAGSLDAEGEFGEVDLEMGAGDVRVAGSATQLTADISAGRAEIDLADVRGAELTLNAGELTGRLSGPAPALVTVSVSAGSLDLGLPDDTYDISSEIAAGGFDNGLRESSGSSHRVFVEVSAGSVTLRPL